MKKILQFSQVEIEEILRAHVEQMGYEEVEVVLMIDCDEEPKPDAVSADVEYQVEPKAAKKSPKKKDPWS